MLCFRRLSKDMQRGAESCAYIRRSRKLRPCGVPRVCRATGPVVPRYCTSREYFRGAFIEILFGGAELVQPQACSCGTAVASHPNTYLEVWQANVARGEPTSVPRRAHTQHCFVSAWVAERASSPTGESVSSQTTIVRQSASAQHTTSRQETAAKRAPPFSLLGVFPSRLRYLSLSLYLPTFLSSIYLCACLSVALCVSVILSFCLFGLYVYLSHLCVSASLCLCLSLCVSLSVCLSLFVCMCLCVWLSVRLSLSSCVCVCLSAASLASQNFDPRPGRERSPSSLRRRQVLTSEHRVGLFFVMPMLTTMLLLLPFAPRHVRGSGG